MKKLVIIPAFNEEECIFDTVNMVKTKASDFDYVVINDCSKDTTLKICKENDINVIDLPVNLGIGGAVQTGYKYALKNGYDYAVQLDGDGQHDPTYLAFMVDKMEKEGQNMIIGSRFIEKKGFQSSWLRRIGIKYFTCLIFLLTGKKVTDATSGFRIIDKEVIKIFANDYPRDYPEPESVVTVLKKKLRVEEVPVIMRERQGGVSSINIRKSVYYMIKVSIALILERIR